MLHRLVPGREAEVLEAAGAPAQRPLLGVGLSSSQITPCISAEVGPVVLFEEHAQQLADRGEVVVVAPGAVVELALQRLRAVGRRPVVVAGRLLEHLDARLQVQHQQLRVERVDARAGRRCARSPPARRSSRRARAGRARSRCQASRSTAAVTCSGVASSSIQAESARPIAFTVKQSSASGSSGITRSGSGSRSSSSPRAAERRVADQRDLLLRRGRAQRLDAPRDDRCRASSSTARGSSGARGRADMGAQR